MHDHPLLYLAHPDAELRHAVEQVLGQEFTVRTFGDAMSCIALLSERPPAILLLSDQLADLSARDACEAVRQDSHLDATHVRVLVSPGASQETLHDLLLAGCDECLPLPVDLPGLCRELRNYLRLTADHAALRQQASYAQQVAMTAMTSMGELGVVMQFLSKCFACSTSADVAKEVASSLTQYNLNGSVQIRAGAEYFNLSTLGDGAAGDVEVIERLRGIGRIFEFKTRMVINYEHVSILMNDVPDDSDQRGRIRDNVAMLAEGANARIISLLIEADNRRKQGGIRFALGEILSMTDELRHQQHDAQIRGQAAVSEVIAEFEAAFIRFGLTPLQESEMIGMLVNLRHEIEHLGLSALEIDRKLQGVVRSLQSIADESL